MTSLKPGNTARDDRAGLCRYFLHHKRRYCKFKVISPDNDLCVFHTQTEDRVPCPLDPNHTVKKEELNLHLTRCTARPPKAQPIWYVENHNLPEADTCAAALTPRETSNLHIGNLAQILNLASVTELALEGVSIRKDIQSHQVMDDRLQAAVQSKHSLQQASLIGQLSKMGVMEDADLFIEWGAGRAELSYFLQQALPDRVVPPKLLLIDRDAGRLKRDGQILKKYLHADLDAIGSIKRHKVDIAHVDLFKMIKVEFPALQSPVVCSVSKHLCGAATDLTLNCLSTYKSLRPGRMTLLIAVCCHQLCSWHSLGLSARTYLASKGVTRHNFAILCKMTSWHASSGTSDRADHTSTKHWTGLSMASRSDIGWRCKRLVDLARIADLHDRGWTAELLQYIEVQVTMECYALLATRSGD